MKKSFRWNFFSVIFLIAFSACQSSVEVEDQDEHLDEITSLIERYVSDEAILVMGSDHPELFEGASAMGRTSGNIPYAQFTGDDIWLLSFAIAFSKTDGFLDEIEICPLKAGAGLGTQRRSAKCIDAVFERGACVVMGREKSGDVHAHPWSCPAEQDQNV